MFAHIQWHIAAQILLRHDSHLMVARRDRREMNAGDRRDEINFVTVFVTLHVDDDDVYFHF